MNRLRPLEHWDSGFESHSRHECLFVYSAFVLFCVGSGLTSGWSTVRGILPTVHGLRNWKSDQRPQGLQSHRWIDRGKQCGSNCESLFILSSSQTLSISPKRYKGARALHILSNTGLTLTLLPWKWNLFLLSNHSWLLNTEEQRNSPIL
jgi:hypothetical protein